MVCVSFRVECRGIDLNTNAKENMDIERQLESVLRDLQSGKTAVRGGLEANSQLVAKPLSLQAVGKAYTDGTAQFRAIAKSINLQPQ